MEFPLCTRMCTNLLSDRQVTYYMVLHVDRYKLEVCKMGQEKIKKRPLYPLLSTHTHRTTEVHFGTFSRHLKMFAGFLLSPPLHSSCSWQSYWPGAVTLSPQFLNSFTSFNFPQSLQPSSSSCPPWLCYTLLHITLHCADLDCMLPPCSLYLTGARFTQ